MKQLWQWPPTLSSVIGVVGLVYTLLQAYQTGHMDMPMLGASLASYIVPQAPPKV